MIRHFLSMRVIARNSTAKLCVGKICENCFDDAMLCANEFMCFNVNKSPTAGTITDRAGHFLHLYVGM